MSKIIGERTTIEAVTKEKEVHFKDALVKVRIVDEVPVSALLRWGKWKVTPTKGLKPPLRDFIPDDKKGLAIELDSGVMLIFEAVKHLTK